MPLTSMPQAASSSECNVIEYDGSLSRAERAVNCSDNWSLHETIDIDAAAKALLMRRQSAAKINPNSTLPQDQVISATGQTAMYLDALRNYTAGNVTRD
ncbi:hypothetical protein P280DRAFT_97405 [Massarina eburnea CBS 473.64]|uniref:Uncharacterized protein n=1 Tax=Massarina eburnea CBS 473.64 TaxID=1395130 RepID=A0A6A6RTX9_9PLEO|nr:hypothetical protein P280DRAFT_97405 [Massarina eburnea CBS 473.64]